MALLQLAESPFSHLAESNAMSNYIFIPAGMFDQLEDTYVREDFFDSLSDQEYQEVITALAQYQNQGMSAVGMIVASGTAKPIFKSGGKLAGLKDKVTGAINKLKNESNAGSEKKVPVDITGSVAGTSFDITSGQPEAEPFLTKYKTPLLVAGGLTGAYLLYKAVIKK